MAWEAGKCPNCGNFDSLVPLPTDLRHVTWEQHDGRKVEVIQYRCIACGAADLIRRDWMKDHEKDEPSKGHFAEIDGRMFVPRLLTEEG